MSKSLLETVERAPPGEHRWSVIWLHGLGADGHDFEPIVAELRLPRRHGLRFVFPYAPHRPVTINAGMTMRAWYDIANTDPGAGEDEAGIRDSAAHLASLIERERALGVPDARILVAGFSQGGAVALHTGLRHAGMLGGIVVLSAYLPLASTLATELAPANQGTPIFQAHGDMDEVVPPALARASFDRIAAGREAPTWRAYSGMGHAVCGPEIDDLRAWLSDAVAAF
jgi:phospholipase/carboxylesterase